MTATPTTHETLIRVMAAWMRRTQAHGGHLLGSVNKESDDAQFALVLARAERWLAENEEATR